jgi:uncharacterized repeat protein (TIGR01451 family)
MKIARTFLGCAVLALAGTGVEAASALGVTEQWRFAPVGYGIGIAGLQVADLDGDGDREIVVGTVAGYWHVLERLPGGGFEPTWISDIATSLTAVRVAQLDGDPALEVVVGASGRLSIYDGATRVLERSWPAAKPHFNGLSIADVDGDGALEAVFCNGYPVASPGDGTLYVYDLATGVQEYASAPETCQDVAVGNVDADPVPEIVVGNGLQTGYVLDGATRAVEWANPFGAHVRLADLDGDGIKEVVAGFSGSGVSIFRAPTQSLAGTIPVFDLSALQVVDVEGDGPLEIVYGDGQSGGVHVHNGQMLALKWEVANPEHGVTEIAFGDVDGDLAAELLWGAGYTSTGPDHLYIVDSVTRALEWQSLDLPGPFIAFAHGDVDADGRPEILYASEQSDSNYAGGRWFVRDAETTALEYASPTPASFVDSILRMATAQLDADAPQEIVIGDTGSGRGVSCVDGSTHVMQWAFPTETAISALAVTDVDGDGTTEVVATAGDQRGAYVFVLDGASGALEWQSPPLNSVGAPLVYLRVANLDADPQPEIVVARWSGSVYVFDGTTHQRDDLGDHHVTALDVADRNFDGVREILIGDRDGRILVLTPTGSVAETVAQLSDGVDALGVVEVTGDAVLDYVFTTRSSVRIRDGATGAEAWNSGPLHQSLGWGVVGGLDALHVANVDLDLRREIVVGLGSLGIRIYEIPSTVDVALSVTDTPDPALVTSNVTYTWTVANTSTLAAASVGLIVDLPVNATLVSSPPGCLPSSGGITCLIGPVAGGSSTNLVIVVAPFGAGTLSTHAWAASSEPDPDRTNNLAFATTTVTSTVQADLAAAVDDDRVLVATGQTLTYAVSVANLGPWPVTSVRLANPLPATLENPVYTPAVGSYDPGSGAWTGLDLQSGGSASLTLTATVATAASGTIANPLSVLPPSGVDDLFAGNNSAVDVDVVAVDRTDLQHGTTRTAVLDAAGERYFAIGQRAYSSYEVVVDEVSGDVGEIASPLRLERLSSGLDVLTSASATGVGFSRTLRWMSTSSTAVEGEAVRVASTSCDTDCGPDDAFRIRAYDTTYDLARFNNSGGQGTVVVLQNNGAAAASGRLYFWSASGALLASVPFAALPPHGVLIVNTAALAGTAGLSGSITIANDAPYGALAGKAVAVDPATGAAFDTLLRARPR